MSKTGPIENKGVTPELENKGVTPELENKASTPARENKATDSYDEQARRGGHFDPRFPHPFGSELPDLGEVAGG